VCVCMRVCLRECECVNACMCLRACSRHLLSILFPPVNDVDALVTAPPPAINRRNELGLCVHSCA
jgi:hypothetical protein